MESLPGCCPVLTMNGPPEASAGGDWPLLEVWLELPSSAIMSSEQPVGRLSAALCNVKHCCFVPPVPLGTVTQFWTGGGWYVPAEARGPFAATSSAIPALVNCGKGSAS